MSIVMVWQDLRIRRFTPLAQQLFNILPTDIGRSIIDMRHNIEIEGFATLLSQTINHDTVVEQLVKSRDGRSYWLRLSPYHSHDRSVDGAIVILLDIETLAQTQESLRQRIEELAAADRHKNEFLAILAHELRNPLASLRNAVQILNRSEGDAAIAEKARALIDRQVHHMSRLVSDLLDAARAENGQIKLQRTCIDVRVAIEHVVDLLQPMFESKQQALTVHLPAAAIWVEADPTRLEQILTNLLSNASKYTQAAGKIVIELTARESEGVPFASIEVTDNGDGIDAELLPMLFELFTQADRSLAHSQGGLGIGLSLVRTLVTMHGGAVSARSAGRNQGSCFEVRLPIQSPPQQLGLADKQKPLAAPRSERQQRVLLVEDSEDIRDSTRELLCLAGFEVIGVASGLEALEKAPGFGPNAVLLDVGLPDMSGYEVARRLRENPRFASVLFIALTGYDTPEARALSAAAGFDHHMVKPINFDNLAALLS
jgi:signal transduction histidine kinase